MILFVGAPPKAGASDWSEGLSATSVGRFGWWPGWDASALHFDGLLANRICPDALQRSLYSGEIWEVGFGARSSGDVEGDLLLDVPWLNWAGRRVDVSRGDFEYSITYNSLSPGVLLSTFESEFFIEPSPAPFGLLCYRQNGAEVIHNLAQAPADTLLYDRSADGPWEENWALLWFEQGAIERQIPFLLIFSLNPLEVVKSGGELTFSFDAAPTDSASVLMVTPFGVGSLSDQDVSAWAAGLPESVRSKIQALSRQLLDFPIACEEHYRVSAETATVQVRNRFSYLSIDDAWGTTHQTIAPYPPLVTFAEQTGYPAVREGVPQSLDYPTKYGMLEADLGTDSLTYTLPLAPDHTCNFVDGSGAHEFKKLVRQSINQSTHNSVDWSYDSNKTARPCLHTQSWGIQGALLLTTADHRERYLSKARWLVENVLFDMSFWREQIPEPTTGRSYVYCRWDSAGRAFDQDHSNSIPLQYAYQYALFTSDWGALSSRWDEIQDVFSYLTLVNDWAWMASSCRDWGSGGAFYDMFPPQWMGLVAYARIAQMLETTGLQPAATGEYERGLYLASKAMVPLTMRFRMRDYYIQEEPYGPYYDMSDPVHGDLGVSGFGELEPVKSDLATIRCGNPTGIRRYLSSEYRPTANVISGGRLQPIVYRIYKHLVPDEFETYVLDAAGYNDDNWTLQEVGSKFPYNVLLANLEAGQGPDYVIDRYDHLVTARPESSEAQQVYGPPVYGFERSPYVLAALANQEIPVQLADWGPGKVTEASFDQETGTLRLQFENDWPSAPAVVKVLSGEPPIAVTIDNVPQPFDYDPVWDVASVSVEGTGSFEVDFEFAFLGEAPPPEPPEANLLINPGFEDCGDSPNYIRAWWKWAPVDINMVDPGIEYEVVHSGRKSLHMRTTDTTQEVKLYQDVFLDPDRAYRFSFWYNVPDDLPEESFTVTLRRSVDSVGPSGIPPTSMVFHFPPDSIPTGGWRQMEALLEPTPELHDVLRMSMVLSNCESCELLIDDVAVLDTLFAQGIEEPPRAGDRGQGAEAALLACQPQPPLGVRWVCVLPQGATAMIDIFDVAGRRVKRLSLEGLTAGRQEVWWDGVDDRGRPSPSGLYFYRFGADRPLAAGKVALLR